MNHFTFFVFVPPLLSLTLIQSSRIPDRSVLFDRLRPYTNARAVDGAASAMRTAGCAQKSSNMLSQERKPAQTQARAYISPRTLRAGPVVTSLPPPSPVPSKKTNNVNWKRPPPQTAHGTPAPYGLFIVDKTAFGTLAAPPFAYMENTLTIVLSFRCFCSK